MQWNQALDFVSAISQVRVVPNTLTFGAATNAIDTAIRVVPTRSPSERSALSEGNYTVPGWGTPLDPHECILVALGGRVAEFGAALRRAFRIAIDEA